LQLANPFCGSTLNLQWLNLTCVGGVIDEIIFASYGTPSGSFCNW
jgi:hypothetical protein